MQQMIDPGQFQYEMYNPLADVEGELEEIGKGGIEQIHSIEEELFRFDLIFLYLYG